MPASEATTAPPLFRRHIRRPRLTRLLDESKAQSIILNAPAGYGKTVLAQEWLQGRSDVAWYRATPASADVAAFSVGVAEVVQPLVPGAGEQLRHRLRVPEAPEQVTRALAEILSDDLAAWPRGAMLVLDDYHLVADSTAVEEFMDWLLTFTRIRVLVTTRRRPMWASARRFLYGELVEITQNQLAMTASEARQILVDRSSEAVRTLMSQAQGWPALIGLAALSGDSAIPDDEVSDALFRYIAEEVFRRQPPEVREFMLAAAIPASVTHRVAHEVLGFEEPAPLVDHLIAEGVVHQSGEGDLRFHPLLRDFLRHRLDVENPELARRHSEKALEHARTAGRWEEAFDLAVGTEHLDVAVEILGQASSALLDEGRLETLESWISLCGPYALKAVPALLTRSAVLFRRGHPSEAAAIAHDLARGLPAGSPHAAHAWNLAGQAFHMADQDRRALQCHLIARELAVRPVDVRDATWGAVVNSAELELQETLSYVRDLEGIASDDPNWQFLIPAAHMYSHSVTGTFQGIWDRFEPLLPLVDDLADPLTKSRFLATATYITVVRGHYERGLDLASRAIDVCQRLHLDAGVTICLAYRCRAEIGLGRFTTAAATLRELDAALRERDDLWIRNECATLLLRLALAQRDIPRMRQAANLTVIPHVSPAQRGDHEALLALAFAVMGDHTEAASRAELSRSLTTNTEASYYSRLAEVISALIQRERAAIRTTLMLTREIANADFIDALVVAYRAYPRIHTVLSQDAETLEILRAALGLAEDQALGLRMGIEVATPHGSALGRAPLTRRETQVLALIAEGLSNRDIADRLVISHSTAKVHVHNIFKKIGARTRAQAVSIAKDMRRPF